MNYFAGLDVSMEETHICVLDGEGAIAREATVPSSPTAIAAALKKAPRLYSGWCSRRVAWRQCSIMA